MAKQLQKQLAKTRRQLKRVGTPEAYRELSSWAYFLNQEIKNRKKPKKYRKTRNFEEFSK